MCVFMWFECGLNVVWIRIGIGLTSFSIDYETDVSDRLVLLVTLLLTMVAFSLVIDDEIPQVPYLTYLEEYIIISFVFLAYLAIQTALAPFLDLDDKHWFYYSLIIFISYQLIFIIYGIIIRHIEKDRINCDKNNKSTETHQIKEYVHTATKGAFALEYCTKDIYNIKHNNSHNQKQLTFKQTIDMKAENVYSLNQNYMKRRQSRSSMSKYAINNASKNGYTNIQADQ